VSLLLVASLAQAAEYVPIPGSNLRTVLPPDGKSAPAKVAPFELRTLPVTNREFHAFVKAHPEWRRDRVAPVFADSAYLSKWSSPAAPGDAAPDEPVTGVSWFAAQAYCETENARLPTWYEWELAAAADETRADARDDPLWRERILGWYSRPSGDRLAPVGRTAKNVFGVQDLHGVVWEWVDDFSGLMISADNREQGDPNLLKFCGAGALSTADRENYAILMRIALLSSINAQQTTRNLGFRCARNPKPESKK
jgi:formylglycine-generating enzyme required for sulfatase activity